MDGSSVLVDLDQIGLQRCCWLAEFSTVKTGFTRPGNDVVAAVCLGHGPQSGLCWSTRWPTATRVCHVQRSEEAVVSVGSSILD